jgi:hypothetical protein
MGANPMTTDGISPAPARERLLVAAICLAAAFRVFLFCAAFPFFNIVDEQGHFDQVFKYSRGHLPSTPMEKFDPEAAKIIAFCGTAEYFNKHLDRIPASKVDSTISFWTNLNNNETWAWPTYYLAAGFWYRLGKFFGLANIQLLYWIRFLNVPLVAVFVWLSYLLTTKIYSKNRQCRIAVPILVAFFPQDIFFSITSDVLSPVAFAAAFLMLFNIYVDEIPAPGKWKYYLLTGLIVAATFLTKVSNVAILPLAAIVIIIKIKQAASKNQLKPYLPCPAAFIAAAVIPIAFWFGRNHILVGDAFGSAATIKLLTWTKKPLSEIFNHPIFTPQGLFFFLTELTKTFWRGEFTWRTKLLTHPLSDLFYVISSAAFLIASLTSFIFNNPKPDKSYRFATRAAVFVVILSVLFLAFLSIRFDFGSCYNPSRNRPYFTSGRLIAGAVLPFLLLYVQGLQNILSKLRLASFLLIAVVVIAIGITLSEVFITLPVFASPCNWFHFK